MFKGSNVALITPFRKGAVDEKGFQDFVDWQIKEGTHGLVPCGTTGESPTLSHHEHKRVVELCIEVAKGRVVAAATPHAGHRNPAGTVHGGLAATLLDSAMGLAVQSMLDKGFAQTTLEFKISLVRPITPQTGLVKAEGKVISCGRRVGTAEGKLTDKDGRVLAHGTTTCLIYAH